jgi:septal ring factor EnvC (AmiA/AmiB activator)
MEEKRSILSDRLVVPLTAVISAFLVISPGIFWASNLTTRVNSQDRQIAELNTRIQANEDDDLRDNIRLTVVETNYASVLQTLTEIKVSLKKLEERFNLK